MSFPTDQKNECPNLFQGCSCLNSSIAPADQVKPNNISSKQKFATTRHNVQRRVLQDSYLSW